MNNLETQLNAQTLEASDNRIALAFDRKIFLADNSEWNGAVGLDPENDSLWVWLDEGISMVDAFAAFSDPEKTGRIKTVINAILSHDVITSEYTGYVKLMDLKYRENKISIRLNKNL